MEILFLSIRERVGCRSNIKRSNKRDWKGVKKLVSINSFDFFSFISSEIKFIGRINKEKAAEVIFMVNYLLIGFIHMPQSLNLKDM